MRAAPGVEPPSGAGDAVREPLAELVDAAARRGGREVWAHVAITLGAGEFVAVLGPNGSGKSTLLRVLLGLLPLSAGRRHVLGRAPAATRREVGYLPQRGGFDASVR